MMALMSVSIVFIVRTSAQRILLEERKRMLAGLEYQKEMLRSNIETQEQERERISADLHDSLASKLNVARLMLGNPAYTTDGVKAIVDEVIESSRKMAYELYPQSLADFGLFEVIKDLLRSVAGQLDIRFVDLSQQHESGMERESEAHVYRIIQEILNNVLRHAGATSLDVIVRISSRYFVIKISDNGHGFDTNKKSTGHGRKNMESRAQLVNASFRITSQPGFGTSFILVVKKK